MRFVNGSEQGQEASFWGLRVDSPLVMSYPQDKKNLIHSIALGMGLKPSGIKINNQKIGPTSPAAPTPMALGSASQVKSFTACADAQVSKQKTVSETRKNENSSMLASSSASLVSNKILKILHLCLLHNSIINFLVDSLETQLPRDWKICSQI